MITSSKCKQICINILSLCKHQRKTPDLKLKTFFSLNYKTSRVFRWLEQLSSIFWWRVMAIYNMSVFHPRLAFVGVEILTTFWCLCHYFGPRYARKSVKCSKDSDDSLVSKTNLSQKIGSLGWRPVPGKVGHKNAKTLLLVTSLQENSKPNWNFFSVETRRFAESVDGLNSSQAIAAGELWSKEYRPLSWPARALKGFKKQKVEN